MSKNKRIISSIVFSIISVLFVIFFYELRGNKKNNNDFFIHKEKVKENIKSKKVEIEKKKKIKENIWKYQEIDMPFHVSDYWDYGIWEIMVDFNGKLCSFGKVYDSQKNMMIFWNDKGQKEKEFLPIDVFPKHPATWSPSIVPYQNGKQKGYIIYQQIEETYFCYFIGEKGNLIQKISLEKFLKENKLKEKTTISGVIPIGKDKIAVIMRYHQEMPYQEIPNYILYINIKKNQLINIEKYNYGIIGVDKNYCYAIQYTNQNDKRPYCVAYRSSFTYGQLVIINRKTGKRIASIEIPKEMSKDDDKINIDKLPVHCFEIKDNVIWLANRTGIYYMELGNFEWINIMDSEQSSYLNENYTLSDFVVIDRTLFYLLSYLGDDAETAEYLTKYELKK